jgi:RNA polymerase sigma-70 factor (ECF subfamily)
MKKADKNIIKKISRGDLSAFEKLFKDYYEELCYFANRYLNDMDQSEEVVQDTFFIIWQNRRKIDIKQSVKSYLYTSVKNKSLKKIRSKSYEDKYKEHLVKQGSETASTPLEELNAKELNLLINRTLNSLPERTRKVFKMSREEGLKYQEIAKKLSISVKTVEADMGKALKLFRKKLNEYQEAS